MRASLCCLVSRMSDRADHEAAMKYLKQICIAVAIFLLFYGALLILNLLLNVADFPVGDGLRILSQVIVAIFLIFIGIRIYSVAKTIRATSPPQLWRRTRPYLSAALLGCITLLPIMLYPLPFSSSLYTRPFLLYSSHTPISFEYVLSDSWDFRNGGAIYMFTTYRYPSMCYQILVDNISTSQGWIIMPYAIDGSNAVLTAFGPAEAEIELGFIENGDYDLEIVMSDSTDSFRIHKTESKFWIEEAKSSLGSVFSEDEFEKRLDGFVIDFGFEENNEIRSYAVRSIGKVGGEITDTWMPGDPIPWRVRFYYKGDFSNLSNIIVELANQYPSSFVCLLGNIGHRASIGQYTSTILALPEHADQMRTLVTDHGLAIYSEGMYGTYDTTRMRNVDFVELHVSSATLGKPFSAVRSEIIESIESELGLKFGMDSDYFVYG